MSFDTWIHLLELLLVLGIALTVYWVVRAKKE